MNAPATPPDWDTIARFLSGESPAEEAAVVRAWLEANPAERELVQRLNTAAVIDAPADVDVEAALTRVHQRMREPAPPRLRMERGGISGPVRFAWFIGATAAAVAAFTFIQSRTHSTSAPVTVAAHTYSTGVGQRDSVRLADGSHVLLGPQSKLVVPADFAEKMRAVELTGDAYFDVQHDAAKPFTVRTAGAVIEDIGTTFTVESDAGAVTSVAVVTGSVRLRGENAPAASGAVLAAGDRGSVDARGNTHVEPHAVREEDTAWIGGRLAFRDAPFSHVAAELERWYGVKVRLTDSSLLTRPVTTSFEGESVDRALEILGLTIGAKIEHRGDSVIVTPHRGPATSR